MSGKSLTITIPLYIEEVKLSNARRKRFFRRKDRIPEKYKDERYIFKKHGREMHLFDAEEKAFVVANPIAVGTPNIMRISGNEIYARMHERKRMAIVDAIKNNFAPHLPREMYLKFPIMIDIDLYTTPKFSNWDLDNMWIYNKCFQDLMKDKGLIPEDNVMFITKPGAPRFLPIIHEEDRKMVFILTEDDHPIIQSHIMYDLQRPKDFIYMSKGLQHTLPGKYFEIRRGLEGKTGDLYIDGTSQTFYIQMGKKKLIHGGLIKGLGRVYSQCIQMNCYPYVNQDFFNKFNSFLKKELLDKGVPVYVSR